MTNVVRTKWGYVTPAAMHRIKEGYEVAVTMHADEFTVDGQTLVTRFAKYLLEFLELQGLKPEKGADDEPIFRSEPI